MGFEGFSEPLRQAAGKENVGANANAFASARTASSLVDRTYPAQHHLVPHSCFSMNIALVGCIVVLVFALIGYNRGLLRVLALFVSLFGAGMLAAALAPVVQPAFGHFHLIPRALVPLAGMLAAGLTLFVVFCVLFDWLLRRRERRREAEKLPRLGLCERLAGAILGGLWGATLLVLILAGLHQLASIRQSLDKAGLAPAADGKRLIDYDSIAAAVDASAIAPVVAAANPYDAKLARIVGNLATVTGDPVLFARFQRHPSIAHLLENPDLLAVSRDAEVRNLLDQQRYYDLLDHPKIAALLQNRELVAACRQVDLDAVLLDVVGHTVQQAPEGPRD